MRKRNTWRKYIGMVTAVAALCAGLRMSAAAKEETAEAAADADRQVRAAYEEYQGRLNGITRRAQIADSGFRVIEDQIFPLETDCYGEILLVPAMEERYQRLVLFFTKEDGTVVYRTDQRYATPGIPPQSYPEHWNQPYSMPHNPCRCQPRLFPVLLKNREWPFLT